MSGRRGVAVVGVGEFGVGVAPPGMTDLDLIGRAAADALADAGLTTRDVDGLFAASATDLLPTLTVGEYLGLRPTYAGGANVGGSAYVGYLEEAALAIEAGRCEVALIVYGSTQRSERGGLAAATRPVPYEDPFRPWLPVSAYALTAARYLHEFGAAREQLAEVAVAARRWAQLNPAAFARGDLSVADVLAAPMVSSPLTVRDCCLVTDGGGAVVVTSAQRARDLPQPPAYVLGAAAAQWHMNVTQMPDLTTTAAQESGKRAFASAGLSPADVDVAQLYDAFSINTLLFLEDLGFCKKGEAAGFVADGSISPGGVLPVNTSGGGLSYAHPGMLGVFLIIEGVRQLRGTCGARQVVGAEVALVHGNGGRLSSQATAILGCEATL